MGVDVYREFLELARCLNFTQAAQTLHLTQPALSKHIAALEREFGAPLFSRDRRSVALTEAGRALCSYATAIVDAYDGAVSAIASIRDRQPVRVGGVMLDGTVNAIVSLATLLLSQKGLAPLTTVYREDHSPIEQLTRGEIDLAITGITPEQAHELGLACRPLIEIPFVAILDRDHPLASRSSLRMGELANETFVHFVDPYASAAWNDIVACCKRHGFEPRTRPLLGNTATYAAVQPEGAVLIQQANLRQLKFIEESGTVAIVPLSDRDACFTISCVVRKDDVRRLAGHLAVFEEARNRAAAHGRGGE